MCRGSTWTSVSHATTERPPVTADTSQGRAPALVDRVDSLPSVCHRSTNVESNLSSMTVVHRSTPNPLASVQPPVFLPNAFYGTGDRSKVQAKTVLHERADVGQLNAQTRKQNPHMSPLCINLDSALTIQTRLLTSIEKVKKVTKAGTAAEPVHLPLQPSSQSCRSPRKGTD